MATSRLKVKRVERGLTQAELAKRAGVGLTTIVSLESGKHIATGKTMIAIAKALGANVTDLFFDATV